ncbi:DNA repair protein endonuclease SAE2/CtIP C-terminus-domain-containing protein [Camillea tinctor]|nr:DNA repair protein endonuclease SAE2/CtIP C-terminus-domain-containing protein [Camillea tinctor]
MENWFKDSGRPALFEALVEVCNRLTNDFDAGIRTLIQERTELALEVDSLKQTASDANHLEKENRSLKQEIDRLKKTSRLEPLSKDYTGPEDTNRDARTPLAPRSANLTPSSKRPDKPKRLDIEDSKLPDLKKEYWKLESNYAKLHAKYLELEGVHAESTRLLRERTAVYHQWVHHAKQLNEQVQSRNRKINKLEAKLAEATQSPLRLSSCSDTENVQSAKRHEPPVLDENDLRVSGNNTPPQLYPVSRFLSALYPPLDNDDRGHGSSTRIGLFSIQKATEPREDKVEESTYDVENEEEGGPAPTLPPLPLPRKEKTINSRPFIKSEPSSDTPVIVSERSLRKRKHMDEKPANPVPPRIKTEPSSDPLSLDEPRYSSASESVDFDIAGPNIQTPRKRSKSYRESGSGYAKFAEPNRASPEVNDSTSEQLGGGTIIDRHGNARNGSAPAGNETRVQMEEYETNNSLTFRSDSSSTIHRRTVNKSTGGRSSTNLSSKRGKSPSISDGLASVMETDDSDDSVSENIQGKHVPTTDPVQIELPPRRQLPFGKDGSTKAKNPAERNSGPVSLEYERTPTAINHRRSLRATAGLNDKADNAVPLRELPRSELRLDHFKINPAANDGYNYAYADVVRNKEQRAALQGCISETCCGPMFRDLAKASRRSTGSVAFQSLLESYLGDECYKLSTMLDIEKEQLWVKAKMIELANQQGKHRHRYQRMTTPPGYWRTDFPSTQEGEKDREKAAKLEQDMIEERYREAIRPGGRWLFRDE